MPFFDEITSIRNFFLNFSNSYTKNNNNHVTTNVWYFVNDSTTIVLRTVVVTNAQTGICLSTSSILS